MRIITENSTYVIEDVVRAGQAAFRVTKVGGQVLTTEGTHPRFGLGDYFVGRTLTNLWPGKRPMLSDIVEHGHPGAVDCQGPCHRRTLIFSEIQEVQP